MTPEQMNKLLAPLIKVVQAEAVSTMKAENVQLKAKLKKASEQRDEWRYQAQKYQKTILEMKGKK